MAFFHEWVHQIMQIMCLTFVIILQTVINDLKTCNNFNTSAAMNILYIFEQRNKIVQFTSKD